MQNKTLEAFTALFSAASTKRLEKATSFEIAAKICLASILTRRVRLPDAVVGLEGEGTFVCLCL